MPGLVIVVPVEGDPVVRVVAGSYEEEQRVRVELERRDLLAQVETALARLAGAREDAWRHSLPGTQTLTKMRRRSQRSGTRDYLALASVAVVSVFLSALVAFSVIALLVQREQVAYERANRKCETSAPRGVTGWKLRWSAENEMFTCVFGRNGRSTGQMVRIRRSDLG